MKLHMDEIATIQRAINGDGVSIEFAQRILAEIRETAREHEEVDVCVLEDERESIIATMQENVEKYQAQLQATADAINEMVRQHVCPGCGAKIAELDALTEEGDSECDCCDECTHKCDQSE